MIISDFAPHDLEFLREDHAHRRLGFSDEEVRNWCGAANLQLEKIETLSPAASTAKKGAKEKLTVKIWLCAASAGVLQISRANAQLEREQNMSALKCIFRILSAQNG